MKKASIRQLYYFTMICQVVALICGIAGSVIILINYNEFISSVGKVLGIIFLIAIIGLFIVLIIVSLKAIVSLLLDLKAFKNKEYISIIGKVKKFKRNRDMESGVQINDKPVVLNLDTNEEIELIINDKIIIGETYKFNYLKNCKIAEVVEIINN